MAEKYHISPSTGNPNRCYANTKPCPLGGAEDHYPSKEAARKGFEKKQDSGLSGLKKTKKASPAPAATKKVAAKAAPKSPVLDKEEVELPDPSLDEMDDAAFDPDSVDDWEDDLFKEDEKEEWGDDDDVWDSSRMNPDEYEERTGTYTYSWGR